MCLENTLKASNVLYQQPDSADYNCQKMHSNIRNGLCGVQCLTSKQKMSCAKRDPTLDF